METIISFGETKRMKCLEIKCHNINNCAELDRPDGSLCDLHMEREQALNAELRVAMIALDEMPWEDEGWEDELPEWEEDWADRPEWLRG